jgi:Flp pilus assembly protein TadG
MDVGCKGAKGESMSFRKDESGQIMVLTALSMTIVFGFMALAIDVGLMFNAKRKLQNAADAAATSAAIDYMFNGSQTTARTAANDAVSANRISNPTVTVNFNPSIQSAYHNSSSYVEVFINQSNPTFFARALRLNSMNISTHAVAGMPGPGNACIIVLDNLNETAMELQGSFLVDAGGCGVVVNATSSAALDFTGNGGYIDAKYISVVGDGSGGGVNGYHAGESSVVPTVGAAPVSNPLPGTSVPDPSTACTVSNTFTASSYSNMTFASNSTGITCFNYGTVKHGVTTPAPVTLTDVTLPPGIAIFRSGVNLSGTIRTGTGTSGTAIDVAGGALTVQTNTNLDLHANPDQPVTSPTNTLGKGIAIYQPSNNTNRLTLQSGSACGTVNGIIYAPTAELYLNDSGGDNCGGTGFGDLSLNTDLIVWRLTDKTATMNISNYNNTFGTNGPLTVVTLVE